jgi:hypothetical protein
MQLSSDSSSNINNNNISKQQQMMMNANFNTSEIKPTLSQNDFWFNDKINEAPAKPPSPVRPSKSLFSPSPEHPDEKSKYMMMTNMKQERMAVDSPKEERKSTPSKREKMMSGISTPVNQSQKPQMPDKKYIKNEINPPSTVDMAALSQDSLMPNKKRPYATVKDESLSNIRAEKVRKVEGMKMESTPRMSQLFGSLDTPTIPAKQPIETNPDIVKSLLKECFSSNNKFDQYDNDSPLDVINPEPPEELLAVPKIESHMKKEPMDINLTTATKTNAESDDKMDSSAGEGHSGKHKKKSKKKKEKHKHKKKHKHSDRESSPPTTKFIVSKPNSPESNSAFGGLKIKIPIKDVASAINPQQAPQPIKLKISKGSFTNLNNNNSSTPSAAPMQSSSSSSSSSHKKKDKDRDKSKSSKSSKHGSDYKESSSYHHHQQHSA